MSNMYQHIIFINFTLQYITSYKFLVNFFPNFIYFSEKNFFFMNFSTYDGTLNPVWHVCSHFSAVFQIVIVLNMLFIQILSKFLHFKKNMSLGQLSIRVKFGNFQSFEGRFFLIMTFSYLKWLIHVQGTQM